jgi:hypothetical protein
MNRPLIDVDLLREHLAYEVHYMILAARRFPEIKCREAAFYQDSALLHSRNLLDFTDAQRHSYTLWIGDVGGRRPREEGLYRDWKDFINAQVTHLGPDRLTGHPWPDKDVAGRLIELARYALTRIEYSLSHGRAVKPPIRGAEMHVAVMKELAELGLAYLATHDERKLDQIADALDNPLPIQARSVTR